MIPYKMSDDTEIARWYLSQPGNCDSLFINLEILLLLLTLIWGNFTTFEYLIRLENLSFARSTFPNFNGVPHPQAEIFFKGVLNVHWLEVPPKELVPVESSCCVNVA